MKYATKLASVTAARAESIARFRIRLMIVLGKAVCYAGPIVTSQIVEKAMPKAQFKVFRSQFNSWETMAEEVADYLTSLGPDKVIGVSHSQVQQLGVIVVWYWAKP